MEPEIVFAPSAFKHRVTEADIRYAYKTRVFARRLEGYDNKYGFIGFNRAGNPIEVFYKPHRRRYDKGFSRDGYASRSA